MTKLSPRHFILGLLIGAGLSLTTVALLYKSGYLFMPPASSSTSETLGDKEIICWVSPNDPNFIRMAPGKDAQGRDLIPVFRTAGSAASPQAASPQKKRRIKYWVSPMDPGYIRDQPGKAPCGMDLVPVYEDDADGDATGTIAVAPHTLQSMGVRTTKAEVRPLKRRLRAVARVTIDEHKLYQVNSKVAGWVERLYVKGTGEAIKKGQPLLALYSPELVSGQQEYLVARKNLQNLEKASYPELTEAARRLVQASRQRLAYWDIGPEQINTLEKTGEVKKALTLTSPAGGLVLKRMVTEGMMVQPGMSLMEVVDLSTVWVEAEVYEYELPWVKVGAHAEMTLSYLPGETFHGRVDYLYPYLSGTSRTAKVRLVFANPHLKLKPEMFAEVKIDTPGLEAVVAVPGEAVLDSGERQLVFLALGGGRFEPRQVKLGLTGDDGWRQVTQGLKGGEEVVTSAQFLLDSESRLREAVAKMLQAPLAAPAPGTTTPEPPRPAAPSPHIHKH